MIYFTNQPGTCSKYMQYNKSRYLYRFNLLHVRRTQPVSLLNFFTSPLLKRTNRSLNIHLKAVDFNANHKVPNSLITLH